MPSLLKLNPYRNKKLLQAANGEPCIRCGSYQGVSSCHYAGFRQHAYGKGRGIKCSDLMTAYLCGDCHKYFDEYTSMKGLIALHNQQRYIELSEEFLHLVALTNIRRVEQGVIK